MQRYMCKGKIHRATVTETDSRWLALRPQSI
ncbi:aspartate 1-decarboxylase [Neobacillus niacini]|nr:aspartate 1-decarboxylase [Neobacillus niacini]